jgi:hypothetical protein
MQEVTFNELWTRHAAAMGSHGAQAVREGAVAAAGVVQAALSWAAP